MWAASSSSHPSPMPAPQPDLPRVLRRFPQHSLHRQQMWEPFRLCTLLADSVCSSASRPQSNVGQHVVHRCLPLPSTLSTHLTST